MERLRSATSRCRTVCLTSTDVIKVLTLTKSKVKAELADKMQKSLGLDREKVQWDHRLQQSEI